MEATERYDSLIHWYAQQYGLDWTWLKAQIRAESNFNPGACSVAGAVGLAQFMPKTWLQYGRSRSRLDPESNIEAQAHYMADLLHMFHGDVLSSLASYNWGEGNVTKAKQQFGDRWLDEAPQETRQYVHRIVAYQQEYSHPGNAGTSILA